MNQGRVLQVARTAFREFWRTPEAVFWTYGFPLLMTVVLGFAFQPREPQPVPVAVVASGDAGADAALRERLLGPRLRVEVLDAAAADAALARGRIAALVHGPPQAPTLRADPMRADAETARLLLERALRDAQGVAFVPPAFEPELRPGARYIDFLIPGLVGLNLLGAGLWGIGFNLVQYRTQHLLRRLLVTPLRRSEFLLGFLLSRLLLVVPESLAIVLFGMVFWGVPFRGSVPAALLLLFSSSLAFSGLGVLVASRARSIEAVSGLMNLVMLPMWLLGGSFFSNERMEGWLGAIAAALPLTWCNDGLRDLMLAPGSLGDVLAPIGLSLGFAALCLLVALRIFRWT